VCHVLVYKKIVLYANLVVKIINGSSGVQPMKMIGGEGWRWKVKSGVSCKQGWFERGRQPLSFQEVTHTVALKSTNVLQCHLLGIATYYRQK